MAKGVKPILKGIVMIVCVIGLSVGISTVLKGQRAEHEVKIGEVYSSLAYSLTDISNIRYKGFTDTDIYKIDNLFSGDLSSILKAHFQENTVDHFISLEGYFQELDEKVASVNAMSESDREFNIYNNLDKTDNDIYIQEQNNTRGIYLSDLERNKYVVKMYGLDQELGKQDYIGGLIGNDDYNFQLMNYYSYTEGNQKKMRVVVQSRSNKYRLEYTVSIENNKISQIDRLDYLYSKLI